MRVTRRHSSVVSQHNFRSRIPVRPTFTAVSPPSSMTVGVPVTYQFVATGSPPPTFAVHNGALPAGLSLTSGGLLTGTPAVARVVRIRGRSV